MSTHNPPYSVSVIIPVVDEAESLRQTIEQILAENTVAINQLLIVVCERTSKAVHETIADQQLRSKIEIVVVPQRLPGLGGAFLAALDQAAGTHVITMFSDLESDPGYVRALISTALESPEAIVSVSRWLPGGGFERYGRLKLILNRISQKCFALLFWSDVTDFTYGYRIYPTRLLRELKPRETGHRFVLEIMLLALLQSRKVIEIPGRWHLRVEGTRGIPLSAYFPYWTLALSLWASRVLLGKKSR